MIVVLFLIGCEAKQKNPLPISKDVLEKTLLDHPEIIANVIEKHPEVILKALSSASRGIQEKMDQDRGEAQRQQLEGYFDSPIVMEIKSSDVIRGPKDGKLTLIEYTDFECPFCAKAHGIIMQLKSKYPDDLRIVYRNLPLDFHKQAMISAKYYEAIKLQSGAKATFFHDKVFEDQPRLSSDGENFLKEIAVKLDLDMNKLVKDIESEAVSAKIREDIERAKSLGIQGTPGFILNGIPVKGAYPLEYFEMLIEELTQRGLLK